jgi:hypothetical protein
MVDGEPAGSYLSYPIRPAADSRLVIIPAINVALPPAASQAAAILYLSEVLF